MCPFIQPCFHPVIDTHNTHITGLIDPSAVSFHECQNTAGVTRQHAEGAQALLRITILYVCVNIATAHSALLCSQDIKAYTIANVVAHRPMDSLLTSSQGHPFLMTTPIYAIMQLSL